MEDFDLTCILYHSYFILFNPQQKRKTKRKQQQKPRFRQAEWLGDSPTHWTSQLWMSRVTQLCPTHSPLLLIEATSSINQLARDNAGWQLLLTNPPFLLFPPHCSFKHRILFRRHTWKILKISTETQMSLSSVDVTPKRWTEGLSTFYSPETSFSKPVLNQ